MKRVINWAHYRDNWADYSEAVVTTLHESLVALLFIVFLIPAFFVVLAGFAPSEVDNG